jgi:hypothetical protein
LDHKLPAYERYGSPLSILPIRKRSRNGSPESNFNDATFEDDEDGESGDRLSIEDGSDSSSSSGTISILNLHRPAVDVFVERFVDAFAPEVDPRHGRAGALRAAAGIRMFSPLISDAFEAVSVAFFGRSIQNKQIEASGFRLYPRVLRSLQEALVDPERSKAESTLVTVILLLAFEVCILCVQHLHHSTFLTAAECGTHDTTRCPGSCSRCSAFD